CRARADHWGLAAESAGRALRAPLHRAGAPRRADRRGACRADGSARRRCAIGGSAPVHPDARGQRGALEDTDQLLARRLHRAPGAAAGVPHACPATQPVGLSEEGEQEMKTTYLIVGGGLTGDAACQGIRDVDTDGTIALV